MEMLGFIPKCYASLQIGTRMFESVEENESTTCKVVFGEEPFQVKNKMFLSD